MKIWRNPSSTPHVLLTLTMSTFLAHLCISPVENLGMPRTGTILHSFVDLAFSSMLDDELYRLMKSRLNDVDNYKNHTSPLTSRQIKELHRYVEDFEDSTLKHLQGLVRVPSDLNEMLESYSESHSWATQEHLLAASNFVVVYRMTNRFAKYGEHVRNFISLDNDASTTLVQRLIADYFHGQWPGPVDHDLILSTFLSSYKTHDLYIDPVSFVSEITADSLSPVRLTAEMSYDISMKAWENQDYVQALDWINHAIALADMSDNTISNRVLRATKQNMIEKHNIDIFCVPGWDTRYYATEVNVTESNTLMERGWRRRKDIQSFHFRQNPGPEFNDIRTWSLCTRQNLQPLGVRARLKCYLDTWSHPWLRINPLQVEVLSEDPEILQFYNIVGNGLGQRLIQQIENSTKTTSTVNQVKDSDMAKLLAVRTSINTWFDDEELPELVKISEIVTGLESRSSLGSNMSEPFQAVEYIVGRHYVAHTDVGDVGKEHNSRANTVSGLRSATLLFYLNDVDLGGYTAFTNAGVAVAPVKGSAVFWKNLYRNGTIRDDTWHASCPVLYGRKFVINKWFRSFIQFRKLPCSLNSNV